MPLVDVTDRAGDADIRALLSVLTWTGRPDHLDRIVSTYSADGPRLLAFEEGGRISGVIGIELTSKGGAVIRHIAVDLAARGSGVGQAMVEGILDRFHPSVLSAETDAEAVGFYRSCGFTVRSLGEKYPGTERFLCERRPN